MAWIIIAIIIVVGWYFYNKRKNTITITKEQAIMFSDLAKKEAENLDAQQHDIVDKVAIDGKTVSIDSVFKYGENLTGKEKDAFISMKLNLIDRYGQTIPINTAHRLANEIEGRCKMWSDAPGCFERHLQRREGNLLFPPHRRIITRKEIEEAKEKDRIDQQKYAEDVVSLKEKVGSMIGTIPHNQIISTLRETQTLLEWGAAIGGDIDNYIDALTALETLLMEAMNKAFPEETDNLKVLHSHAVLQRIQYLAQSKRPDSPILKEEEIPSLLSEDFETISFVGYLSRSFGPDFRPNTADIKNHLALSLKNGFSQRRADAIMAAWTTKRNNE